MSGFHYEFARASAWLWPAMAEHLWQATLFAAGIYALTFMLRSGPARLRHALWLVAAAKFALPSTLFVPLAARLGLDASALFGARAGGGTALVLFLSGPLPDRLEVAAAALAPHDEVYCALTLMWLAGCAAFASVWAARRAGTRRALGGTREVWSGREFDALERARGRLGLSKDVRLALAQHRAEPCVWGTRRPTVVLPAEVCCEMSDEELESVMLHELTHVWRRDNLLASLQAALCWLFWFHPIIWLVNRRLLSERERACDERVMEAGGAPEAYAAAILKVVRFCFGRRVAGVSGAAAGSDLRRRIEMIMSGGRKHRTPRWQGALPAAAAAAALAVTLGPALQGRAASAQSRGEGRATAVGVGGARALPPGGEQGPAVREIVQSPQVAVYFENASGAPVVFTEAAMRVITREQLRRAEGELGAFVGEIGDSDFYATLPVVTLANVSEKRVKEVGFGFEREGRVDVITGYAASLAPGESQTFHAEWGRRNVVMLGDASGLRLRLVWAAFEDGSVWGGLPRGLARPEARPQSGTGGAGFPTRRDRGQRAEQADDAAEARGGAQPDPPPPMPSVRGGVLNGKLISKPLPVYPAIAKAARAQGTVAVQVVIAEDGTVESAEAVSGHPLLRRAAAVAARNARFSPTRLSGRPVKVTGVITYNFVLSGEEEDAPQP